MTIRELIQRLQMFPLDSEVLVRDTQDSEEATFEVHRIAGFAFQCDEEGTSGQLEIRL